MQKNRALLQSPHNAFELEKEVLTMRSFARTASMKLGCSNLATCKLEVYSSFPPPTVETVKLPPSLFVRMTKVTQILTFSPTGANGLSAPTYPTWTPTEISSAMVWKSLMDLTPMVETQYLPV